MGLLKDFDIFVPFNFFLAYKVRFGQILSL